MKNRGTCLRVLFAALILVLAGLVLWPRADLIVSGWFYVPGRGFPSGDNFLFNVLHLAAYKGARVLGVVLAILAALSAIRRARVLGLDRKAWLFLFLGLVLGPALLANGILKDHWGRARPADVTEFGGDKVFTPPLIPADQCSHNCAFVSGDGAFGFYLPVFAYVVPRKLSRRVFWGGMGLGALFAFSRIAAGAHFFSDNLFAAVFMQAVLALLHATLYGTAATRSFWRNWMFVVCKTKG